MHRSGLSISEVSRQTGISRAAIRDWVVNPEKLTERAEEMCVRCAPFPSLPEPQSSYSYLLGLYLGDGCISYAGDRKKEVWGLRIFCANTWPGLTHECVGTLQALLPHHRIGTVPRPGCTEVVARWKHWPCLFPQHGPGRKHKRRIELTPWQRDIVDRHPEKLVRGLFHSDGCRVTNRVRRTVAGREKWYEYPRYFFANESQDIMEILGSALDRIHIEWKVSSARNLSVAKRDSVARLDSFVGPKYCPFAPHSPQRTLSTSSPKVEQRFEKWATITAWTLAKSWTGPSDCTPGDGPTAPWPRRAACLSTPSATGAPAGAAAPRSRRGGPPVPPTARAAPPPNSMPPPTPTCSASTSATGTSPRTGAVSTSWRSSATTPTPA